MKQECHQIFLHCWHVDGRTRDVWTSLGRCKFLLLLYLMAHGKYFK